VSRTPDIGGSPGRRAVLVATGAGVLLLSFWVTLTVIDSTIPADLKLADIPLTNEDGTPRATRRSTVRDLPPPPTGGFGMAWDGVDGLNVQIIGPGPISTDFSAYSLLATRDAGPHRLGLQVVGLPTDRAIRLTIWVKAPEGTRINLDARDGRNKTGQSANNGMASIDVTHAKVLASSGNVQTSTHAGPGDWVGVSLQTRTVDGLVVVYLGLLSSSGVTDFVGNGELMIFGGIEFSTS
jgi:hypothetical protein